MDHNHHILMAHSQITARHAWLSEKWKNKETNKETADITSYINATRKKSVSLFREKKIFSKIEHSVRCLANMSSGISVIEMALFQSKCCAFILLLIVFFQSSDTTNSCLQDPRFKSSCLQRWFKFWKEPTLKFVLRRDYCRSNES